MIEIHNLTFQPLTLHLAGDGGGIHLGSRERRVITNEQLSDEIRSAAARGFVALSEAGSTLPDPRVETVDVEHNIEPAGDDESQAKQRKRRQA